MSDKKNTILFSKVDREDGWVCGGLAFRVKNTETYEDAYNEIKHKLESPEVIEHVIKNRCLLDDLFDGDESFKFVETYWAHGLWFIFKNDDEEEAEYRMSANFIFVVD
jgi:hypothetical protein